jgi:hypothetical protein
MNPEASIKAYLDANKGSLRFARIDEIVQQVKLFVFYGASPISDDEVRKIIARWAIFNPVWLLPEPPLGKPSVPPAPGPPSPTPDSDFIDAVKKAITTVSNGVTVRKGAGSVTIGISGLTANLRQCRGPSGEDGDEKCDSSASLEISWSGTLGLRANSGPFHFSSDLSKDKWEMTLSFPQDAPVYDLSTLGKVFSDGERAVRNIAAATASFNNLNDARKIGALIKPDVAAVEDAVKAARGIAEANKKGGMSFGFKLGSPEPGPGEQGIPKGVQGTAVFTYWF